MTVAFYLVPKRTKNLYCRLSDGASRKTFSLGYSVPVKKNLDDETLIKKANISHVLLKLDQELTDYAERETLGFGSTDRLEMIHLHAQTLLENGFENLIYVLYELSSVIPPSSFNLSLAIFEKAFKSHIGEKVAYQIDFGYFPLFLVGNTDQVVFTKKLLNRVIRQAVNKCDGVFLSMFFKFSILQKIFLELRIDTKKVLVTMDEKVGRYKYALELQNNTTSGNKGDEEYIKIGEKAQTNYLRLLLLYPHLTQDEFLQKIFGLELLWPALMAIFEHVDNRLFLDQYIDLYCQRACWKPINLLLEGTSIPETFFIGDSYTIWADEGESLAETETINDTFESHIKTGINPI